MAQDGQDAARGRRAPPGAGAAASGPSLPKLPPLGSPADTAAASDAVPHGGLGALKPGNATAATHTAASRRSAQGGRRPAKRRPAGPARPKVAANDDAPSIGGLIFALQQKPSNRPFQVAAAASGGWLAIGAILAWAIAGVRAGVGASPARC